jgi:hypothetical protein
MERRQTCGRINAVDVDPDIQEYRNSFLATR